MLGTGSTHQQFLLQYLTWLGRILHGDLGYSRLRNESVTSLLAASLPRTLALMGISTLIALAVAIPLGLVQAARRGRAADHVLRGLTYLFYGMPTFVLGAVLVLFFAVDKHLFGAEGPQAPGIVGVITDVRDLTLPVLTLTLVTIATFARSCLGRFDRMANAASESGSVCSSRFFIRPATIVIFLFAKSTSDHGNSANSSRRSAVSRPKRIMSRACAGSVSTAAQIIRSVSIVGAFLRGAPGFGRSPRSRSSRGLRSIISRRRHHVRNWFRPPKVRRFSACELGKSSSIRRTISLVTPPIAMVSAFIRRMAFLA